ncbi:YopX family protein [Mogibacterium timidum]
MREIKFRAWDKEHKEWANYSITDNKLEFYAKRIDRWKLDQKGRRIVLSQYTGLKDKNDREIYEGDILISKASENPKDHKMWLVSYQDGGFVIDYKHKPKDRRKRSKCETEILCEDNIWLYGMEVKSNIYENPELLKELTNDK